MEGHGQDPGATVAAVVCQGMHISFDHVLLNCQPPDCQLADCQTLVVVKMVRMPQTALRQAWTEAPTSCRAE